jgi:hypothetical protein
MRGVAPFNGPGWPAGRFSKMPLTLARSQFFCKPEKAAQKETVAIQKTID